MTLPEWSRSRFWLCHFLHNRHERAAIRWEAAEARPGVPEAWLARGRMQPPIDTVRMIVRAAKRYDDDPAYVQSLRLMVKEQQYHGQLVGKLADQCGVRPRPARWWRGPWAALLALAGVRFELSVLLLSDLIEAQVLSLVERSAATPAGRGTCGLILRDKQSHAAFFAERLTMELADLNFLRRNLRRLRLRVMFAVMLAVTLVAQNRLIRATGSSRRRFALEALRSFQPVLERVVPYHRDALLAALLAQRERPYDKPTVV